MAAVGKESAPVMGRAAGFHGDRTGRDQRFGPALESGAAQDLPIDDATAMIEDADAEHVLGQVDADGSNLLHNFPSQYGLMMMSLNRGTLMPCDVTVASGRGSPSYSLEPTSYGRHRLAAPGQALHRPCAASRLLPPRSAQLQR